MYLPPYKEADTPFHIQGDKRWCLNFTNHMHFLSLEVMCCGSDTCTQHKMTDKLNISELYGLKHSGFTCMSLPTLDNSPPPLLKLSVGHFEFDKLNFYGTVVPLSSVAPQERLLSLNDCFSVHVCLLHC